MAHQNAEELEEIKRKVDFAKQNDQVAIWDASNGVPLRAAVTRLR
jgi:hypothetical protein